MVGFDVNTNYLMDHVVKKEVIELQGNCKMQKFHDTTVVVDAVPLASHVMEGEKSPKKRLVERKSKILNIKKSSGSTNKHAVSGHVQKFVSNKVVVDGASSRGEANSSAVIRAEEVQSKLEPQFPSFVKSLVRSHVSSCFWMGLPALFCKRHLPDKDATITLEDESGKEYKLKYIAYKTGLSAGWRQFSVVHKLLEGDVLIFQLVEPTKFKVCIIRANHLTEFDGALSLLNLDTSMKPNKGEKDNGNTDAVACTSSKRKRPKPPAIVVQKKKTDAPRLDPKLRHPADRAENNSEAGSEVFESFKPIARTIQFKDVKDIENFCIQIYGISIDSEFSSDVRSKYYKLCHSQHAFLHDKLIMGMNYKLVVGIISETVYIADAIKASNLTTSPTEFTKWDKTLLAFETLGLNVQFLRLRIRRLVSLAFESESATGTRRFLEARTVQSGAEDEISNIEAKLEELKGACDVFGAYVDSLKSKAESYQVKFQEEVVTPW
ncbi:B3 domain-containing protein family [Quillaja saponaria]|uniref:B3 domain-containing protein family n=1 Tax=Quillaja saponaria TaxID=32244 RepID=A0AAD7L7W9_QUISA|nr:B3 domain-containing protein family [Quillaja saponaria]